MEHRSDCIASRAIQLDAVEAKREHVEDVPSSLFSAWARRTLPSASAATRTSSLWGQVDLLSAQELARVLGIPVDWLYVQFRQERLLIDRHPSGAHLFANTPPVIEAVR